MKADRRSEALCRALAGLQSGVSGAVTAVAWLAAIALWQGRPAWTFPALLASVLRPELLLDRAIFLAAACGVSLVVFVGGAAGMVFGLVVRGCDRAPLVVLLGILTGLGEYILLHWAISRTWSWDSLASFERPLLVACLLFGLVLGRYPHGVRSLRGNFLEGA